jgi:hypothetical protein
MSRNECMGACHSVPGDGLETMSETRTRALISAVLSAIGGGVASWGCATTGLSCGLAGVLGADASRQFYKAGTGNDPLVEIALGRGATQEQAAGLALGADVLTATFSIHGAYKGLLLRSTQSLSAGTIGASQFDGASSAYAIIELQRSLNSSQ